MISRCVNLLALVIVGVLCVGSVSPAWAGNVCNVSGNFGTSFFTGPLNGGTFSGSFTAALPISSGTQSITTFDIKLYDSSANLLADLTNTTPGDFANVQVLSANCWNGAATGSCDSFLFSNGAASNFLELITPIGFTGGAVVPFNTSLPTTYNGSFGAVGGNTTSTDSIVTSGAITAVPEPSGLMLLGSSLVGIGSVIRRKIRR